MPELSRLKGTIWTFVPLHAETCFIKHARGWSGMLSASVVIIDLDPKGINPGCPRCPETEVGADGDR